VLILSLAFVGFGAFARDVGFPLWQVMAMALTTWALPSMVVFVVATSQGATLAAAALAVTLSAVRLLPMTVATVPWFRAEPARRIWLYVASHFIAITIYVEAALRLPAVPEERRLSFFLGLGLGLMTIASSAGAIGYLVAGALPAPVLTGLLFLTPAYFLLSMLTAAVNLTERAALGLGLVLGPLFALVDKELALLWAGLGAGTLAWLAGRIARRR
jgi:predicted branched-subunit amino acid permease